MNHYATRENYEFLKNCVSNNVSRETLPDDKMTVTQAVDILTHRKEHWSHEIADAEQLAQNVLIFIGTKNELAFQRMRVYLDAKIREGELK